MQIDGALQSPGGSIYFYSPGVILGLAATLAGFNGSEAAVFRLCEIHAFASYSKERKTCLTLLKRSFLTNNVGVVKSAAEKALNSLIARRVLYEVADGPAGQAGTIAINKWIHQWRDDAGAAVFTQGSPAMGKIMASLTRKGMWKYAAELLAPMAPRRTRQIPFQSSLEDDANAVPPSLEDNLAPDLSSSEDTNQENLSSSEDTNPPIEDSEGPRKAENARKMAALEGVGIDRTALPESAPSLLEAFALANCPEGQSVCEQLRACRAKFSHDSIVVALQELANFPGRLRSPLAMLTATLANPRRAKYQQGKTFAAWLESQRSPQPSAETTKAVYKSDKPGPAAPPPAKEDTPADPLALALEFTHRPSMQQLGAIDEMRRGGGQELAVLRLESWYSQGRHANRIAQIATELANAELIARRLLAAVQQESGAPRLETVRARST